MRRGLPNRSTNEWARLRRRASLTQAELASLCGCSRSLISLIELGKRKPSDEIMAQYLRLAKEVET